MIFRRVSNRISLHEALADPSKLVKLIKERYEDVATLTLLLSRAVGHYASTGDIGPFLTALGTATTLSRGTALAATVNLLADQKVELPPEAMRVLEAALNPVEIIWKASELGVRLPKPIVTLMISNMGCYDLSRLSAMFHERMPDKLTLLEFIRKALKSPWCEGLKEEALKLLAQSMLYGLITAGELKEVFKDVRLKIIIKRKKGAVVSVKMFIGDEEVGDETSQLVTDFLTAAVKAGLIRI